MLTRVVYITVLSLLFAAPVFAQDAANLNRLPICTESQIRSTLNIAIEVVSRIEAAMQDTNLDTFDAVHDAFWNTFLPGLPECVFAQRLGLALGRVVDEVYLIAALNHSGATELVDKHHEMLNTALEELGVYMSEEGIMAAVTTTEGDEIVATTSESTNRFVGSGDDVAGPFDFEDGLYIVEIEYTFRERGFINVRFDRVDGSDFESHIGDIVTAGTYSDRFTMSVDEGRWMASIQAPGDWILTVEKAS